MQNCLYKGKRINAVSVTEEGSYDDKKIIKLAGAKKELLCEDCNTPMFLRICKQRASHFAHWNDQKDKCPYSLYSTKETEYHKKCKEMLRKYFQKLYPDETIETEYKAIPNQMKRSDLFIAFENGEKLAINLHKKTISTNKWDSKHNDYKTAGIVDIYIITGQPHEDEEKNMPFFQQIMLNEAMDDIAIFLNLNEKNVTLLKKASRINTETNKEQTKLFQKTYELEEIKILPNGKIDCKFNSEFKAFEAAWTGAIRTDNKVDDSKTESSIRFFNGSTPMAQISIFPNEAVTSSNISKNSSIETRKERTSSPISKRNNYMSYSFDKKKISGIIRAYLNRVSYGQQDVVIKLVEMLHRASDYYYTFKEIQKEYVDSRNEDMVEICNQVLKRAGMGD